jgi:PAS domain S-box-containing protein
MAAKQVLVSLHCHSSLSDGALSPDALAEKLAAEGVRYASLTDHDTLDGLASFRASLSRRGIGVIDGVEISAASAWGEMHLLGYGFDPADRELAAMLDGVRRYRDPGMTGLVDSLKRIGGKADQPRAGIPSTAEAIAAIHAAGGVAFLAHPLSYGLSAGDLEAAVRVLKGEGLDGLEAIYAPYREEQVRRLEGLASAAGLAVSAGSDYHGPGMPGHSQAAVPMPVPAWEALRALLFRAPAAGQPPAGAAARVGGPHAVDARRLAPGRFAARVVLPAVVAMALFTTSIFALIIPRFERTLLDRKKEMIRELTNSAVSILAEYAADERAGRATRGQAQAAAAARVRDLRYGAEGKDYFWITDMHPTMIMHPYRPELNGTDVTGYTDANGVRVFVEFVKAVVVKEEGYVEYLWQWKDDAHRIVPKLSFVKRFSAWDWVVGTGIYLEDVTAEIGRVTRSLIWLSAGIVVILGLLLFVVTQQSLAIERRRRRAESALRESHERYRALVEASTEGMVVVIGGACTYANGTFLQMLGYGEAELSLLSITDIVRPYHGAEEETRVFLSSLEQPPGSDAAVPANLECSLTGRGGRSVDVVISASEILVGGRAGAILTVRDVGAWSQAGEGVEAGGLPAFWRDGGVGLFRASWGRRAFLLEANTEARRLFGAGGGEDAGRLDFLSLAANPRDAERLFTDLAAGGAVKDRDLEIRRPDGAARTLSLTLILARDEDGGVRHLEGMARDVTEARQRDHSRSELMAELESSSLFLTGLVDDHVREAPWVGTETSIRAAAERMGIDGVDALLVSSPAGDPLGIVTDRDVRDRVVAEGLDLRAPVREIMSSPLVWIPAGSLVSEAVAVMRDKEIGHLVVRGAAGAAVGMVRSRDLLHAHRLSTGAVGRRIREAGSIEEVRGCRGLLVELVRGLAASGAGSRSIGAVFTAASDLIVQKLLDLAMSALGQAPAPFAFLALGSEGRGEQIPGSDQDNAIIFDCPASERESTRAYFLALAGTVCGWLDELGVPYCPGGMMAKTPAWCASREEWVAHFTRWVTLPEPQEILDFNMFFDLRPVTGEQSLARGLLSTVRELLDANPPFFLHHARDAIARKLPAPRKGGVLDAKEAITPVVSFARLYALRHGVEATNTLDRLAALREKGALTAESHDGAARAFTLFQRLRLSSQLDGRGNRVDLSALAPAEEALLRESIAQLALLQKRIGWDFLGASA